MVPGAEHDDERDDAGSHPASAPTPSGRAAALGREGRRSGVPDPRAHAAWRSWLSALARDAEVALAAALTYESLAPEARDAWLDALDADAPQVAVPAVALYAPLLGVEEDETRRARMLAAIGPEAIPTGEPRALRGVSARDEVVLLVVLPLYLDFVEVLVCSLVPERGLAAASHEPLSPCTAFADGMRWEGTLLHEVPVRDAVEELAHAVVFDRRDGRDAPEVLRRFADLFDACA